MALATSGSLSGDPQPSVWRPIHLQIIVSIAAIVCAALAQHPADSGAVPAWVVLVSVLAIVGAAVGLPSPLRPTSDELSPVAERTTDVLAVTALLALPTLGAVILWLREPFSPYDLYIYSSSSWAALVWVAGLLAGLTLAVPRGWWASLTRHLRSPLFIIELCALIIVLDLALGLRLYRLADLPQGIWFDEADFANSAQMLQHIPFQPFGATNVGHNPSLYFYAMAALFKLGGVSIGTARLTSALFGTLGVLAVYLLGRRVGGFPLGFCAAALLAVAQWDIDFSRFGMSNIAAPALISLGFAALSLGLQRPRALWFALAGAFLGLTLLTYAGGFLAGGGVGFAVVALRLGAYRSFRDTAWPRVLLLPLGFVVGAAPFLLMLLVDRQYTLAREQTVSLFTQVQGLHAQINALLSNLKLHALMFTVAGDQNGRHNLPGAPMLDSITGACFLLGLGMCLRRLNHWFHQLLLLWMAASMAGGVLSLTFEAPQGARTIGAIVPIALTAALPLATLASLSYTWLLGISDRRGVTQLKRPWGVDTSKLVAVVCSGVLVLIPLGIAYSHNTQQYFTAQASNMTSWAEMDGLQTILGREGARLHAEGYTVRIEPSLAGDPVVTFAASGLTIPAFDSGTPVTLPVPAPGLALLIPGDAADTLALVERSYPTARVIPLGPDFDPGNTQANAVVITPQDADRNRGVAVRFDGGGVHSTLDHVSGPVPWPVGSNASTRLQVRGTLLIPSAEAWQPIALRLVGAGRATIVIDGQAWGPRGETPYLRLGTGNHSLQIDAAGNTAGSVEIQWSSSVSGAASWQALPATLLEAPTMPTGGLLGLYYIGPAIGATPDLARVDQTVDTYYQTPPVGGNFPFAARWLGTIRIAHTGAYAFRLDSVGPSGLLIDGKPVVQSTGSPMAESLSLSAGPHTIQLDYSATGSYLHCYLTWAPPGQSFAAIPSTVLEPAHG